MNKGEQLQEEPGNVHARYMDAWKKADLPEPPRAGWRLWIGLIGPGVVLAGTSIGSGEWLFGPAVSAQYGATLLWLALLSIALQAFCNLISMRYAIFCGEPIIVGALRTWPGPRAWTVLFFILDLAAIWPYNASNAAVPLAAAFLGHLPIEQDAVLIKVLGFMIFLGSFVPLIFGGTVYRMLEKIMTIKLVFVLGYLSLIAIFMVSGSVAWEVTTGFVRFGTVPLRPESIMVGRHFNVRKQGDGDVYEIKGTLELDGKLTGDVFTLRDGKRTKKPLQKVADADDSQSQIVLEVIRDAQGMAETNGFSMEIHDGQQTLVVDGIVVDYHHWQASRIRVLSGTESATYASLDEVPEPTRSLLSEYLKHEGLKYTSLIGHVRQHGKLPPLDWAMVVAFIAIAGAGGLTNSMFSNYARDKGWGMGHHVGAIPSTLGGRTIELSHTGITFPLDAHSISRWHGWLRHIFRDQWVWIIASIIGMALPCMMSLEFIRNASVTGDRISAMAAEGIAQRYPNMGSLFWFLTLFCGFLVFAPGQISANDQVSRRWTDIFWTTSKRIQRVGGGEVRYVYYTLLAALAVVGTLILTFFPALQIAKIAAILQNIALGTSALLGLYVNRTLLPKALRPSLFLQLGSVACGVFFIAISVALLFVL